MEEFRGDVSEIPLYTASPEVRSRTRRHIMDKYPEVLELKFTDAMREIKKRLLAGNGIPLELNEEASNMEVLAVLCSSVELFSRYIVLVPHNKELNQRPGVQVCDFSIEGIHEGIWALIPLEIVNNTGRDDNETAYYLAKDYWDSAQSEAFWESHLELESVAMKMKKGQKLDLEIMSNLTGHEYGVLLATGYQVSQWECKLRCVVGETPKLKPDEKLIYVCTLYGISVSIVLTIPQGANSVNQSSISDKVEVAARELCSTIPPAIRGQYPEAEIDAAILFAHNLLINP